MFPAMNIEFALKTSVSHGSLQTMLAMRLSGFGATPDPTSACAEHEHGQTGHAPLQLGFHDALRSDERKCKRGKATIRSRRVK